MLDELHAKVSTTAHPENPDCVCVCTVCSVCPINKSLFPLFHSTHKSISDLYTPRMPNQVGNSRHGENGQGQGGQRQKSKHADDQYRDPLIQTVSGVGGGRAGGATSLCPTAHPCRRQTHRRAQQALPSSTNLDGGVTTASFRRSGPLQ